MNAAQDRFDHWFQEYATSNPIGTVNWLSIKAQAIAESDMNPEARSAAGAVGLMQFMAPTWMEWCRRIHPGVPPRSRTDPEWSIELGTCYMADLLGRFKDINIARAAYNWGQGHVRKHLDTHSGLVVAKLPQETQNYLTRINRLYDNLLADWKLA